MSDSKLQNHSMKKLRFIIFLYLIGISAIAQQKFLSSALVERPVYFDISPPLRDMAVFKQVNADISWKDGIVMNNFNSRHHNSQLADGNFSDPSLQYQSGTTQSDSTLQDFE